MMKTSCLTLLFLVLSLAGISTQAALYSEIGDAGNLSAPQALNGPYTGLAGNLGGTDTADAFVFHFGGGGLTAFGQLLYPPTPIFLPILSPRNRCFLPCSIHPNPMMMFRYQSPLPTSMAS